MRAGTAFGVALGLLATAHTARADCGRGASCLGRWHKDSAREQQPASQAPLPEEEPEQPAPVAIGAAPAPQSSEKQPRHWYGWQLLIFDGAVIGGLGIADIAKLRGDGATAFAFSLGLVFDIAPPIVHAVHHRGGIAWASFGVRATLPFTVLLTTVLLSSCRDPFDNRCRNRTAPNVAAYLGLAAASALDATLFAWDAPAKPKPSRASLQWTPLIAPNSNGATLGVLGTF